MRTRGWLAVALLAVMIGGVPPAAGAQDPVPEFPLPDVVSPGRRAQPATASPASVTVLRAAELRRLGVRTVGEALVFVPESIARVYGGPGSLVTPSIRGSTAEQVLILLDGVPVNGILAGNTDLGTIPIDDVERIEVLRGPFSAIYGSGAMGGVVSIITRRGGAPSVTAGGGSLGAASVGLTVTAGTKISLRYETATGDRPNSDMRAGYLSLRTGTDRAAAQRWDLTLVGTVGARGAPGSTIFPSLGARQEDYRLIGAATFERDRSPAVTDRLRFSARAEGIAFREPAFLIDDRYDATAWVVEWQRVSRPSSRQATTLGVDAATHVLASRSVGNRTATVGALYVQDDRAVGDRMLLSAGVRADAHSIYGVQLNPRAGLVYFVRPDVRLRLAVGRTFRGPALIDLYYPFDGFVRGNPALRPEHAWSVDAGVEAQVAQGLTLRATAFWSDVRDLIIYVPDPSFIFSPQNIGSASLSGISLEAEGALAPGWVARASGTWLRAIDAATSLDLPNRPRVSGSLAVTRLLARGGSVTLAGVAVGERFSDAANAVRLPGYLVANLNAQLPLTSGLAVRATLQNVFEARYEPVLGFPAPGRTVLVELTLRR